MGGFNIRGRGLSPEEGRVVLRSSHATLQGDHAAKEGAVGVPAGADSSG